MFMSDFFMGEIQMFGFGYAPKGWMQCNGQLLSINQNTALFALLGTHFGGDGVRTFALPDLRSQLPMGQGDGPGLSPRVLGEKVGEENHTLLPTENPKHLHSVAVISNPVLANNTDLPGTSQLLAQTNYNGPLAVPTQLYVPDSAPKNTMNGAAIGATGGQPHSNLMPLLAVNFCIALYGIYPSSN
jgi:microcystin-dependent protein